MEENIPTNSSNQKKNKFFPFNSPSKCVWFQWEKKIYVSQQQHNAAQSISRLQKQEKKSIISDSPRQSTHLFEVSISIAVLKTEIFCDFFFN